ncbi:modifier of mdg4-like [Orussus abietinus]|uniref:modifier of mdg4-like n=1 Tax=Orussus abietinus TaxID=222816 RepID=UPI0006252FFD|nr:modifier of mdg4-like [Orussus abietinus]XP_012270173.1 modifier of mdg4-like [Orussus abietinus]XP_023290018.1 modifier of mdg4-like [Orussus abietinus]
MREETMLNLKWDSFPLQLAHSLDSCYEKQQFVDVSLVCKDGTVLKCHKMVLAHSSSFFRRLLEVNDHPYPMIILHDIEADDLKTILNFMYCGEIQVVRSDVGRLLRIAEILEVRGLRQVRKQVEENGVLDEERSASTGMPSLKIVDTRSLSKEIIREQEPTTCGQSKIFKQTSFNLGHEQKSSERRAEVLKGHPIECRRKLEEVQSTSKRLQDVQDRVFSTSKRRESSEALDCARKTEEVPSTSKKSQEVQDRVFSTSKKREDLEQTISWKRILAEISKDKPLPSKRLCLMEEVEISPSRSTNVEHSAPGRVLDRRKSSTSSDSDRTVNYAVIIKDEIDIEFDSQETNATETDVRDVTLCNNNKPFVKSVRSSVESPSTSYGTKGKSTLDFTLKNPRT